MPKFFGTDGIRTKAGDFPLTRPALFTIGQALGELLKNRLGRSAKALIGRDTRESGAWIELALTQGLLDIGAKVDSLGVITTPGVAYLTKTADYDVGIVISASHNPFYDNGIKLFSPSGRKFDEKDEEFIESKLLASDLNAYKSDGTYNQISTKLASRYVEFLKENIANGLNLQGINLAIDCANGAASEIAPKLFQDLGAEVFLLGCEPDGKNINDNCGSLHLNALKSLVKEKKCSLGVAFDGDADRALFVDETGEIVDGDRTIYIMAEYFLKHQLLEPKVVVATVMSNIGLEVALKNLGIELKRTPVGDKYVLEELLTSNALVGGEQSGHIIFPKIGLAGDGIVTALQLLKVLAGSKQKFSELSQAFRTFPQILVNVVVKSKPAFSSVSIIAQAAQKIEEHLAGQGRLLLRYSGTENLARVMIEGKDLQEITDQANYLANIIRQEIG
jgi:phosphoglucosamine mutase